MNGQTVSPNLRKRVKSQHHWKESRLSGHGSLDFLFQLRDLLTDHEPTALRTATRLHWFSCFTCGTCKIIDCSSPERSHPSRHVSLDPSASSTIRVSLADHDPATRSLSRQWTQTKWRCQSTLLFHVRGMWFYCHESRTLSPSRGSEHGMARAVCIDFPVSPWEATCLCVINPDSN